MTGVAGCALFVAGMLLFAAGAAPVAVPLLELSIAAEDTGVALLLEDGWVAPGVPVEPTALALLLEPTELALPVEPTELAPPTEPELVVEPVEPALPALEPVLTATDDGLACVFALLVAEVLLFPLLQATSPKDNNALAKTIIVVFLTMRDISN